MIKIKIFDILTELLTELRNKGDFDIMRFNEPYPKTRLNTFKNSRNNLNYKIDKLKITDTEKKFLKCEINILYCNFYFELQLNELQRQHIKEIQSKLSTLEHKQRKNIKQKRRV